MYIAGCSDGGQTNVPHPPEPNAPKAQLAPKKTALPGTRYPTLVTEYDILTSEDQFYYHHLRPLCEGPDLSDWPLMQSVSELCTDLVDAPVWAALATETIYVSDQPRAKPIIDTVNECAKILGITPPKVFIEGKSEVNAYVAGIESPHVLVFTSGLLDLYSSSPKELRFIIGHELGHIKAQHLRTHFIGRMLTDTLSSPSGAKATLLDSVTAAISVKMLLHWHRESEYSADRAGLICIGGDLAVAKQALLRLMHQTKPDNPLFDPAHPEFDAELVLAEQLRIREQPFAKLLVHMRQSRQSHPFIPERCAAIQAWTLTSSYLTLMEDRNSLPSSRCVAINKVTVTSIPAVDTYIPLVDSGDADPFAIVTYAGVSQTSKHATDSANVSWTGWSKELPCYPGADLIVEVQDHNSALPNKFIGSCLVPIENLQPGNYTVDAKLRLDLWKSSSVVSLPGVSINYTITE